jgi:hypothetical protein
MTSMLFAAGNPTPIDLASSWLQGRTFASLRDEFDARGYLIFERVLSPG